MLTDILWEVIAAAIYNRIASLITIIFPGPLFQDLTQKKPPIKLIIRGLIVYYLFNNYYYTI